VFNEHFDDVGRGLNGAVVAYNRAVGSFETRLLAALRRLESLKVSSEQKPATAPRRIDDVARTTDLPV
jgi:DNA recombination protein RmuC